MALFINGRRSVETRLQAAEWRDVAERDALLKAYADERPRWPAFSFLVAHADPACRELGMTLARNTSGPAMVEALLKEGEGRADSGRRHFLAVALAQPKGAIAVALEARLAESVPPARQAVAWQLALELPAAMRRPYLERAIRSTTGALRSAAVGRYFAELPESVEPPPILFELARDAAEPVRVKALQALERWHTTAVVSCMVERFVSDAPAVQQQALAYLQRTVVANTAMLKEKLVPLAAGPDPAVRKGAVQLLFSCLPAAGALDAVLAYLGGSPGWVRSRALETLGAAGVALTGPIRELLGHPDATVRSHALMVAQVLEGKGLVEPLARLLSDPDWCTRIMAADLLGTSGDEAAVEPLVKALQDPDTRWVAVEALARIGAPRAIHHLVPLLNEPEVENRVEVIDALGRFRDPALLPFMERCATADRSEPVRAAARRAATGLALRLNLSATLPEQNDRAPLERPLERMLQRCREEGASDLHLIAGEPAWVRRAGTLERIPEGPPLSPENTRDWLLPLLDDRRRDELGANGQVDFCFVIPEVGRYRANVYRQRGGLSASFRVIPHHPPGLRDCRIPERAVEALEHHQGLIVVAGPTGSGKSTTLAALVNHINDTRAQHVITIEDPVEFLHAPKSSIVTQREVGRHTESFARAIRAALRQDPDVIVIGELRDVETIRMALTAAETGHLVIATLHTTGAVQTVDRLIESFPPEEHPQVRMSLYESLKYVLCQHLLPRADAEGAVPVFEILKATPSVANVIREGQTFKLQSLLQIGRSAGMQTLDQGLEELLEQGEIAEATFREYASPAQVQP